MGWWLWQAAARLARGAEGFVGAALNLRYMHLKADLEFFE
jgi:hypothetical protein